MSDLGHHAEWLSLIDVSGPFLAEPVLKDAFPQGLEGLDPAKKILVRQAYDEWREALDLDDPEFPRIHRAWIDLILKQVLELDENGAGDILKATDKLSDEVRCELPEHGITLRPDYALMGSEADTRPLILIAVYGSEISLKDLLKGDGWAASPAERIVELCRATGIRLGLVTNGEQWMFVDAPVGAITSFASWYARLWGQEPVTLQAFVNLLGIRRFFVDRSEQLPELLDNSLKFQDEVTDALGEQVRRAVEVLIQALDRADVDRNRELLDGIEPAELYEAGLTVMMRIVFLLSAEERGLLLLSDERYAANYAVSTLRMQLRKESEEILERRWDAWSRLLAIFRAVYGGVDHEAMRLPALGGSLFDPDRFPFLEGRKKGSRWKIDPAAPLPIDNRTVLYLLDSVQLFQGRTLSYLALDIEQIGYVYEGLLERTVVRAKEATLDLDATKSAKKPWVSLPELDDAAATGRNAVEELLKERTGSSASRVRNDLDKTVDEGSADKLLTACHADRTLRDRIRPYFHFIRTDRWGYSLVYPKGAFMVTSGADRRETGTHYTPKSLTEAIVKDTLETIVYVGAANGEPREAWQLRSPAELLALKICDPAMGSGAFLVQVCRWLSERLTEAWAQAEKQGNAVTSEGEVVDEIGSREPLRRDSEDRLITARRLIAERCLYGVDMNPLAVELAKLSIWLVTLAKDRPFGFLDHNLRCGDSLLGITSLQQLNYLDINPGKSGANKLFASKIDQTVSRAIAFRSELRRHPIHDIRDVDAMERLDDEARRLLFVSELVADALVAEIFSANGNTADTTSLSIDAGAALEGDLARISALSERVSGVFCIHRNNRTIARRPLHWPLAFPEVFDNAQDGFDLIVGNPPFLGGKRISTELSRNYERFLKAAFTESKGAADLSAYFFRRSFALLNRAGSLGLLATNSITEGPSRRVGFAVIVAEGGIIFAAKHSFKWPGSANVIASYVCITKAIDRRQKYLDGECVDFVSTRCDTLPERTPAKLKRSDILFSDGKYLSGDGFRLTKLEVNELIAADSKNAQVIRPYLNAELFSSSFDLQPQMWAIDFGEMEYEQASQYKAVLQHLEKTVRPYRDGLTGQIHENRFWLHWDKRTEFFNAVSRRVRILICPRVAKYLMFEFYEPGWIFSDALKVFDIQEYRLFGVLQSNVHYSWARQFSSSLKTDLRYSTDDALRTFPLPDSKALQTVSDSAEAYHRQRLSVMMTKREGLTDTYNRFNDPSDQAVEIKELRAVSVNLDRSVTDAYGWNDIGLDEGFHKTPNGDRFTISENSRREIIGRLLDLNAKESAVEDLGHKSKQRPSPSTDSSGANLFNVGISSASEDDLTNLLGDENARTKRKRR